MPATVEHPKTAQMNFRLDPETKVKGDAALAEAGYTPSEAARSLWEVAASGRYRPELIRSFLSGTIAVEYDSTAKAKGKEEEPFIPSEKARRSLEQSDALVEKIHQTYLAMGITEEQLRTLQPAPIDDTEYLEADDHELLELAIYEHYLEEEKDIAPMSAEEIAAQLAKL